MEFKQRLQDYSEMEFLDFVKKIWAVDVRKEDHDKLIEHFDTIVGHPQGADLLFYPQDEDTGSAFYDASVVLSVKQWHHSNGKPAFKGDVVPVAVPRQPAVRLSPQERALQRSSENLAKVQKIVAQISSAGQEAGAALSHFDQLLGQPQAKQASGPAGQQLAQLWVDVSALESAQRDATRAVRKLEAMESRVKFAREGAQRDVSSPFLDRGLQATILEQITQSSDQYLAQQSFVSQRHRELLGRAALLFDGIELQLDRLSAAIAKPPTTFTSPAAIANVRPWVMYSERSSQIIESAFVGLQKAIRSAVAEFTWQITSTDAGHPGTCACVLQFHFSSLAGDKRFGLSVPLAELYQIEGRNWQNLAAAGAEVDLPFRLSSAMGPLKSGSLSIAARKIESLPQVLLTPTDGNIVPARVRVRAAVWNKQLAAFCFTTEGAAPTTLLWTPAATLETHAETSTVAPSAPQQIGYFQTPPVPLPEPFSGLKAVQFDDYIVVFPTGSGLAPIYVMLRDCR